MGKQEDREPAMLPSVLGTGFFHTWTLCDPMDCSPPGSSVHGIFKARIPEREPFPSPEDLFNPGIEPRTSVLQADS